MEPDWANGLRATIMVCDEQGRIVWMNDAAAERYAEDGGRSLIGRSLRDCHSPESNEKIARLIAAGQPNHYTIEKGGRRRMIHQMPWFEGGRCAGLVEIGTDIPESMAHFNRDQAG